MNLILGSSSPFRQKVLEEAGLTFEVVKPEIDEKKIRTYDPEHTPLVLSYSKALAVAKKVVEPSIIIACDQVVICNGKILEKPQSEDEVRVWYALYSQHPVRYVNGLTVLNTKTGESITAKEVAIADFKEIPGSFVEEQIEKGVIFNCAGGIGDETHEMYATLVQGSKQSAIGLPLDFVLEMIEKVK